MHLPTLAAAAFKPALSLGLAAMLACSPAAAGIFDARDPGAPVCKARYVMPYWDSYRVFGVYELSNGDRLRVRREATHYFAEMGRTGRIEILPLSPNRFAEKGGPLRLFFNEEALDTQDDVTITGLEQPRPAARACGD
jgi:hypothetical protein